MAETDEQKTLRGLAMRVHELERGLAVCAGYIVLLDDDDVEVDEQVRAGLLEQLKEYVCWFEDDDKKFRRILLKQQAAPEPRSAAPPPGANTSL